MMDFDLSADQRDLVDGLDRLLRAHAGPDRARSLDGNVDRDLDRRLADAGWYSVLAAGTADETVDAVLVLQAIAHALGNVTAIGTALVGPALGVGRAPGPLPILDPDGLGRFAAEAEEGLQLRDGVVHLCRLDPARAERLESPYGQSLGRVHVLGREAVGAPAERMLALWRLGIAAEACGLMAGALALLVLHLGVREQFGRPLAAFQALRHRLAELFVLVEGARLTAYESAWQGAPEEGSAVAATLSCVAARRVIRESHQMAGAMGLTREYDLHQWTLRLHAVSLEAGGRRSHARAAALTHWQRAVQDGRPALHAS